MKSTTLLAGLTGLSVCLIACGPKATPASPAKTIAARADNSMTSLDWAGVYSGTLPCADCEGIETALQLNRDKTYVLATRHRGKSEAIRQTKGTFAWNEAGNQITLNGPDRTKTPTVYAVRENRLVQHDVSGKPITGNAANRYVLRKKSPTITETYWKLVELNGKPVARPATNQREAHMILRTGNRRVQGHGGCNTFRGLYELLDGNRIRFSPTATTRKACPTAMDTEDQFLKALTTADSYTLKDGTLSLNRARTAPLARFEAVYFR